MQLEHLILIFEDCNVSVEMKEVFNIPIEFISLISWLSYPMNLILSNGSWLPYPMFVSFAHCTFLGDQPSTGNHIEQLHEVCIFRFPWTCFWAWISIFILVFTLKNDDLQWVNIMNLRLISFHESLHPWRYCGLH